MREIVQLLESAAVTAALLATAAFLSKRLVGGWLDAHFNQALENYKSDRAKELQRIEHDHAGKLEEIRSQLANVSHRVQKIHDKEIEILSEAWRKLKTAEGHSFALIRPGSESSDYDSMPEELLKEAVEKLPFAQFYKRKLLNAEKKNELYYKLNRHHIHREAEQGAIELGNFVLDNAPFLSAEMKAQFEAVVLALRRTALHDRMNREMREQGMAGKPRDPPEWAEVTPLVGSIEVLIRERLRYEEA